MRKIVLCLMVTALSLLFNPLQTTAAHTATDSSLLITRPASADSLLLRLDEINAMDKTGLDSLDRKELRTEVLNIRNLPGTQTQGVFLSVGAIILIVLLLIILF